MAPPFEDEPQNVGEKRAEVRGEARAKLQARIETNERAIHELRDGQGEIKAEVRHVARTVEQLARNQEGKDTVQKALAAAAQEAVARQISRREFRVAATTVMVMLIGILVTVALTVSR
jgi:hypothetical protein